MFRAVATTFLCLAAALAPGCAPKGLEPGQLRDPEVPTRVRLASVPFFAQQKYQCGPASLAMALSWSGVDTTPSALKEDVYTPGRQGSMQQDLKAACRRRARLAYEISGMEELVHELAEGHPVVVLQNLGLGWFPKWHYAVALGYDLDRRHIILHTGRTRAARKDLDTFAATWRRSDSWGLVVLKPGKMPASAEQKRSLRAALGLEQADSFRAAARAYDAALSRWPDSLTASLGKGNCLYALGEYAAAEVAYRRALGRHPDSPELHNNLAHALLERDNTDAALEAAKKALELAGEEDRRYRDTLQTIRSEAR
ncbi:MAG: PA2778 family cysteine peptidase [Desulfohalobiaceae bacterium]